MIEKTYGLTPSEYEALFAAQGGRCAICRRLPDAQNTRGRLVLFVDHEHSPEERKDRSKRTSGRVRGLLCNDCNLIIGHGATVGRLLAAVEYLRAWS